MNYIWPPHIPELGELVKSYIDSGQPLSIADESGIIKTFEQNFAELHGRKYALSVSSGTMALYSAFFAINLQAGDEVICTAFSYHATAAPLLFFGVRIVFCDVENDTGNIDAQLIEQLITAKTKAIVTNDQWGHPCDKDKILHVCKKYNLLYVEDCSHAHFAKYKGRYTGTFADVSCFSLQGNKLLSGGEGGIMLTDCREFYERAVLLGHNLKRPAQSVKSPAYKPLERTGYGLKLRMHPLAALIVNHQLENYCFDWIKSRAETLNYFESKLDSTFLVPMAKRDYVDSMGAWYGFMPRISQEYTVDRNHFEGWMNERGFQVSVPKSEPIPRYALFSSDEFRINGYDKNIPGYFPMAEKYYSSIVSFPSFTFHEYDLIDSYASAIKDYMRECL